MWLQEVLGEVWIWLKHFVWHSQRTNKNFKRFLFKRKKKNLCDFPREGWRGSVCSTDNLLVPFSALICQRAGYCQMSYAGLPENPTVSPPQMLRMHQKNYQKNLAFVVVVVMCVLDSNSDFQACNADNFPLTVTQVS